RPAAFAGLVPGTYPRVGLLRNHPERAGPAPLGLGRLCALGYRAGGFHAGAGAPEAVAGIVAGRRNRLCRAPARGPARLRAARVRSRAAAGRRAPAPATDVFPAPAACGLPGSGPVQLPLL